VGILPVAETEHFVVYADMLAFRNLVLRHRTTDAKLLHYRRQTTERMVASLAGGNPLQRRFLNFHTVLDETITLVPWPTDVATSSSRIRMSQRHTCHVKPLNAALRGGIRSTWMKRMRGRSGRPITVS
jgi:hypothetical protein